MMRALLRIAAVLLAGAGLWFGHVPSSEAGSAIKAAQSALLKKARSHVKYLKGQFDVGFEQFCSDLKKIHDSFKENAITAEQAWDQAWMLVDDYLDSADDLHDYVLDTMAGNEHDILDVLGLSLDDLYGIRGSLWGDCGAWDYLHDNLDNEWDNFADDLRLKVKKLEFPQFEMDGDLVTLLIPKPIVSYRAPLLSGTVTTSVKIYKPLRFTSLGGFSRVDVANDGRLCASGKADPRNGLTISFRIYEPDGNTIDTTEPLDSATQRWHLKVPSNPLTPGNLIPGNYRIDATQGGTTISGMVGVPK